jgi:hypothetical protein
MTTVSEFEDFLSTYNPQVGALALRLRALILDLLPGTIEQVDPPSKIIAYGYDRTYKGLICAIAPQKAYVNLMFSRGTELPDPSGLLEGTGKRARHVKVRTQEDAERQEVRALILTAKQLWESDQR